MAQRLFGNPETNLTANGNITSKTSPGIIGVSRKCIADVDPSEWGGTAGKHPYTDSMAVHLKPETGSRLKELSVSTGRPPDEIVEDAMAGYLAELAQIRNPVLLAVLHGRRNPRVIAALLRGRD